MNENQPSNSEQTLATKWIQSIQMGQPLYNEIAEKQIQDVYCSGYDLYEKKNYEQAFYFFQVLVFVRPLEKKYWKGLGACQQALKSYLDAIQSYHCFQHLCQDSPDPYVFIHQSDCLFSLNEPQKALKLLEMARFSAEKTKNEQVINHVILMHEAWSKQIQLT